MSVAADLPTPPCQQVPSDVQSLARVDARLGVCFARWFARLRGCRRAEGRRRAGRSHASLGIEGPAGRLWRADESPGRGRSRSHLCQGAGPVRRQAEVRARDRRHRRLSAIAQADAHRAPVGRGLDEREHDAAGQPLAHQHRDERHLPGQHVSGPADRHLQRAALPSS